MQHTVSAVMYYNVFSRLLDDVQRLDLILAVNCFEKFKKIKQKSIHRQTVFKETFRRWLPTAMAELKLFTRLGQT